MATRRTATQEKTPFEQQQQQQKQQFQNQLGTGAAAPPPNAPSDITPAVPSSVILKLLAFTFAMVTFPIGSYFLTVDRLFGGNSTYAGALAAVTANVVLIGYVLVAFWDDQSEREGEEGKKVR